MATIPQPMPNPSRRTAGAPRSKKRGGYPLWRMAFLAAVGLMTVGAAVAVGVFMGYVRSLPPIEKLEYYDPPEISRAYDRTGAVAIGEFKSYNRQLVSINEIPINLQNAFIAIEDSRFNEHYGVDPIGVVRAAMTNFKAGRKVQGGSTLTMQMTRNVLDKEVGRDKTLERKIKESLLAFQVEKRYSKKQILEFYLNQIEFYYSAFGIKAAASTYFSKDLSELTLAECATLAAIPKAPKTYNPFTNPDRVVMRRNLVLKEMLAQGMIDAKQFATAKNEPLRPRRGVREASRFPYFMDALERNLKLDCGVNENTLKEGGLRISSTLDAGIQDACDKALREGLPDVEKLWREKREDRHWTEMKKRWNGSLKPGDMFLMEITDVGKGELSVRLEDYRGKVKLPDALPYYEPDKVIKEGAWIDVKVQTVDGNRITGVLGNERPVQGSAVVLDAHTGQILALVGGTNFYDRDSSGWWNRAIQGGRQVGSCFKPFFYATAFENGMSPADIVVDEPIEFSTVAGPYRPKNYETGEGAFRGPITLTEALMESRNVPTIRLYEALGIKKANRFVERFDFSHKRKSWNIPNEVSSCLGTMDCSPMEIASSYQVFANMGVGVRPQYFTSIVDSSDRSPVSADRFEQQILDPVAAYQIQYLLRQVVLRGTGSRNIGSKFSSPPNPPICGKTGTTNDCRDAWFAGFTPDLVIVVQVGFDTPTSMGRGMTGSTVAAPIWAAAFRDILKTRSDWHMTFEAPEGIELASICAVTGKRASDLCGQLGHMVFSNVPFRKGQAPTEICDNNARTPLIQPVGSSYSYWFGATPYRGLAHAPTLQPGAEPEAPDDSLAE